MTLFPDGPQATPPGEEIKPELKANMLLLKAKEKADEILSMNDAWFTRATVAGSIRRKRERVNDIDIVVECSDVNWYTIKGNMKVLMNARVIASGDKLLRVHIPFDDGLIQVDWNRASIETYGVYLLIRTGSAGHNIWLAKRALSKGMQLNYSKGLTRNGVTVAGRDEGEIFSLLSLPWIDPIKREVNEGGVPVWLG